MLNKNLHELETIQEKANEEDIAMSVSRFQQKNLDIEESYSFSLRNFNYNRNSIIGIP